MARKSVVGIAVFGILNFFSVCAMGDRDGGRKVTEIPLAFVTVPGCWSLGSSKGMKLKKNLQQKDFFDGIDRDLSELEPACAELDSMSKKDSLPPFKSAEVAKSLKNHVNALKSVSGHYERLDEIFNGKKAERNEKKAERRVDFAYRVINDLRALKPVNNESSFPLRDKVLRLVVDIFDRTMLLMIEDIRESILTEL